MKKYKNVISLGYNCHVAKDLERIGYRNASYPFDWLISDFENVIRVINNDFSDWLLQDNVMQDEEHSNVYRDVGTGLDFYHDFFPNNTIEAQYDSVKEKYNRRINRFKEICNEPTLFIRFVRNENDLKYIKENEEQILSVLRKGNPKNHCIYLIIGDDMKNSVDNKLFFKTDAMYHPIKTSYYARRYIRKNVFIKSKVLFSNKKRYMVKRINAIKKRLLKK